jgi:hypothetical protein
MLVIHWSKQNKTGDILKNGIRPKSRKVKDYPTIKGVWCYPYSRNSYAYSHWKRNLKSWRSRSRGNFNGFVFKLEKDDFPIYAGDYFWLASSPENYLIESFEDFDKKYKAEECPTLGDYGFDFEIIISKRIDSSRIIKIIKDRPPIRHK